MPRSDGETLSGAPLRRLVNDILTADDWEAGLSRLADVPPSRLVGSLGSYLVREPALKWRAVTALGEAVARLAAADPEGGRNAVRRFTWMLNDESGGIPWGAPEAIGEILAGSEMLAVEFHHVLVSYVLEEEDGLDNYLEFTPLRRGAWWGVGRLAQARPEFLLPAGERLYAQGRGETDPEITALVCWTLGNIAFVPAAGFFSALAGDGRTIEFFRDRALSSTTVGVLAREALEKIERPHGKCLPETWG